MNQDRLYDEYGIWFEQDEINQLNELKKKELDQALKIARDATWVSRQDKFRYVMGTYRKLSTD